MNKRIASLILAIVMIAALGIGAMAAEQKLVNPTGEAKTYTDVPSDYHLYSEVMNVTRAGLFQGTTATTFSPFNYMSRGQFVMVLARLDGVAKSGGAAEEGRVTDTVFSDVDSNYRFAAAIKWATDNNIVNGYSETDASGATIRTFRPKDPISRAQLAALLHRYVVYKNYTLADAKTIPAQFSDYDKVVTLANGTTSTACPQTFRADLDFGRQKGLIKGYSDGSYRPNIPVGRAQVAAMLDRIILNVTSGGGGGGGGGGGSSTGFTLDRTVVIENSLGTVEYAVYKDGAPYTGKTSNLKADVAGELHIIIQYIDPVDDNELSRFAFVKQNTKQDNIAENITVDLTQEAINALGMNADGTYGQQGSGPDQAGSRYYDAGTLLERAVDKNGVTQAAGSTQKYFEATIATEFEKHAYTLGDALTIDSQLVYSDPDADARWHALAVAGLASQDPDFSATTVGFMPPTAARGTDTLMSMFNALNDSSTQWRTANGGDRIPAAISAVSAVGTTTDDGMFITMSAARFASYLNVERIDSTFKRMADTFAQSDPDILAALYKIYNPDNATADSIIKITKAADGKIDTLTYKGSTLARMVDDSHMNVRSNSNGGADLWNAMYDDIVTQMGVVRATIAGKPDGASKMLFILNSTSSHLTITVTHAAAGAPALTLQDLANALVADGGSAANGMTLNQFWSKIPQGIYGFVVARTVDYTQGRIYNNVPESLKENGVFKTDIKFFFNRYGINTAEDGTMKVTMTQSAYEALSGNQPTPVNPDPTPVNPDPTPVNPDPTPVNPDTPQTVEEAMSEAEDALAEQGIEMITANDVAADTAEVAQAKAAHKEQLAKDPDLTDNIVKSYEDAKAGLSESEWQQKQNDEKDVVEGFDRITNNYTPKDFTAGVVRDTVESLMNTLTKATADAEVGFFVDSDYVNTTYASEVQQFKNSYNNMSTKEQSDLKTQMLTLGGQDADKIIDFFGLTGKF